jgi:hypothetical protein
VINGVLLNPLPYEQPDRLVALYSRTADFQHPSISYPNFLDWLRDNHSFSELAGFRSDTFPHGHGQHGTVDREYGFGGIFLTVLARIAL